MTLQEFKALDYEGRMNATLKAVCIDGRNAANHKVLLFQLKGFYIEVYYNKIYHFISDFVAFDSMDQLDPYLDKIQVSI